MFKLLFASFVAILLSARALPMDLGLSLVSTPEQLSFEEGMPIIVGLEFKNNSIKNIALDLGAEGKEKFRISIKSTSGTMKAKPFIATGLAIPVVLDIPPSGMRQKTLLLDEFIRLKDCGKYTIDIDVHVANSNGLHTQVELEITPSAVTKLAELWGQRLNPKTSSDKILFLTRYFAYGRNPCFWAYQQKLLMEADNLSLDVVTQIVVALLESENGDAIKTIRDSLALPKTLRVIALYQLSQMPESWWNSERRQLFHSFQQDIKSAQPIETSD
jgi:hypothetical protein